MGTIDDHSDIELIRKSNPLGAELRMSCINSIKILNYFESVHGVDTDKVLLRVGKNREFCTNPANWLNNYETFWLYYGCHHAVDGFTHRDWAKVGGSKAPDTVPSYIQAIARLLPLRVIYQRVPWYSRRLSCYSTYSIDAVTNRTVRYRFRIDDPNVRCLYSIGGECQWHQGMLQSLPCLHSPSLPPADVRHGICSMAMGHILQFSYHVPATRFAYTIDGFRFDGRLVARWVKLVAEPGNAGKSLPACCEYRSADALMVATDISLDGQPLFYEGDIHDAPYCQFDVRYKAGFRPLNAIFAKFFNLTGPLEEQVQLIQEKFFEVDRARRALATAKKTIERHSKDLAALVHQRTSDLESANRQLKQEIESRDAFALELTTSLAHKEALLKEIHHRVKNNLQIVFSLLDMTARRTEDEKSVAVLEGARGKIQSMALIHNHLYMSPDLNHIDIRQHVIELAGNLRLIYDAAMNIDIRLNVAQIWLPLGYAMPCSLILNELLTNSFKHAFGKQNKGWIQVFIRTPTARSVAVTVSDSGLGLTGEIIPNAPGTLGLTLVQALVRNQLKSELNYCYCDGAVFEFCFDMQEDEPWRIAF